MMMLASAASRRCLGDQALGGGTDHRDVAVVVAVAPAGVGPERGLERDRAPGPACLGGSGPEVAPAIVMPNPPRNDRPKLGVRRPAKPDKQTEENAASLREQSKTETEEHPYLDTEGGE